MPRSVRRGDAQAHQPLRQGADTHEAEARLVGILALVAGRFPAARRGAADGIGVVVQGFLLDGAEAAGTGQVRIATAA